MNRKLTLLLATITLAVATQSASAQLPDNVTYTGTDTDAVVAIYEAYDQAESELDWRLSIASTAATGWIELIDAGMDSYNPATGEFTMYITVRFHINDPATSQ